MTVCRASIVFVTVALAAAVDGRSPVELRAQSSTAASSSDRPLVDRYCAGCHNERGKAGSLVLNSLDASRPEDHAEVWEKVVRKVRAGMMPPSGAPRPDRAALDAFAETLERNLDRAASARPNPGAPALHRLNRTEYANAIRDLLAVEIDAATLLPADDSSEGFDNIASALGVSPALVERYAAAAAKISRLAVGSLHVSPSTTTYRVSSDFSQADHVDGLPLGTRGGMLFHHNFPVDAEYAFKVGVRGAAIGLALQSLQGEELEISVDGERARLVPAAPAIDLRLTVKAGPHAVGVAFVRKPPPGADEIWQVYATNSGVQSVALTGPFAPSGSGDTPSRRRIFVCRPEAKGSPASELDELACAERILSILSRRAYRQPVKDADVQTLLGFYRSGRAAGTFDTGIEQALARVLVDPRFTFRFEKDPTDVPAGRPYRLSDLELASRLSFFLWSSIPDDELLEVAAAGALHEPAALERETRRMLADPKAGSLVTNFGGQWLYLRELKNVKSDSREFSDNLRQAFRRETEMLLDSILREDRSIIDLLDADYTFVDETLARHYGIPNVRGSRFRRVTVPSDDRRGLLGQSSFLLVTSVSNRTSPVSRGKWVLENLLGVPAPLPPPNVPPLEENGTGNDAPVSVRARMEAHRKNPTCAACHKIMDPIGFSLENFDSIGRWRASDGGTPIDASGQLVDGTRLDGPSSLRRALLERWDVFVRTTTEKLLTYATGRPLTYADMPVVRQIARDARRDNNRLSSLILGVVKSEPFQMRTKLAAEN
jgi:mono/diheme cytochrome c family protein